MTKWDLGFGNSVCVRKAFLSTYHGNMIVFSHNTLMKMDYPERDGDPEIIALTREIIKRQTGEDYKYIVPTNGATGGVVIALRAFRQHGFKQCHTRNAPWYLRYPSMIKASGMQHLDENNFIMSSSVSLIDLPSNPLNSMSTPDTRKNPTILDCVYLNRVYTSGIFKIPNHDVMVGSYSKLTGLNGIRLGWAATNDGVLAEFMRELVVGEYCGLSVPSADIVKSTLMHFNWDEFEVKARAYLDRNRENWSRLEKFFGDKPVDDKGMFFYGPVDRKCYELLRTAGVQWTIGVVLGTNNNFGRFNLGQDCELLDDAVKAILKADRI